MRAERFRELFACLFVGLIAAGSAGAQNPQACQRVQFSEAVLSRFPDAPESCLDVISREGEQFAVMRAELLRVSGNNTLRVRVKKPDGSYGPTQSIRTSPDFRVLIDGEPTRVRDLAPGQELTAYVRVTEPEVALEPAVATAKLIFVPLEVVPARQAAAEPEETLPDTAGPLPRIGLLGALLTAMGLVLTLSRRRRT